jgi:hypothetical protein
MVSNATVGEIHRETNIPPPTYPLRDILNTISLRSYDSKSGNTSPWRELDNSLPFTQPKIQYRVHKSLPLVPILNEMNAVHILFKIQFNVISSSARASSNCFLFSGFAIYILTGDLR